MNINKYITFLHITYLIIFLCYLYNIITDSFYPTQRDIMLLAYSIPIIAYSIIGISIKSWKTNKVFNTVGLLWIGNYIFFNLLNSEQAIEILGLTFFTIFQIIPLMIISAIYILLFISLIKQNLYYIKIVKSILYKIIGIIGLSITVIMVSYNIYFYVFTVLFAFNGIEMLKEPPPKLLF